MNNLLALLRTETDGSSWQAPMDGPIERIFLSVATAIWGLIGGLFLISSAGFWLGISTSPATFWLVSSCAGLSLLVLSFRSAVFWIALSVFVAMVAGSILLAANIFDVSHDGQQYHQQAIIALIQGWNPFLGPPYEGIHSLWLNSYAKAPWIIEATFARTFGGVEYGKALNFLIPCSVLLMGWIFLRYRLCLSRRWAVLGSLLIAFQPVVLYQIASYYNDHLLYGSIVVLILAIVLHDLRASIYTTLLVITTATVAINIKFTGLGFVGAIFLLWTIYSIFQTTTSIAARKLTYIFFVVATMAVLTGFHPYVTNALKFGHPFYPLAGSHKVDIISSNAAPEFLVRNRFEKTALSIFARSNGRVPEDMGNTPQIELKFPLSVSKEEVKAFYKFTDVRVGGFGPLFGAAFLMSLFCLVALWVKRATLSEKTGGLFFLLTASIVVAFIVPEPWWSRYAPTLWLIPLTIGIGVIALAPSRNARLLGQATVWILLVNLLVVGGASGIRNLRDQMDLRAQMAQLSRISNTAPIEVKIATRMSNERRLSEFGVRYVKTNTLTCSNPERMVNSDTLLCFDRSRLEGSLYAEGWIAQLVNKLKD
ncbi:MAG: hypothetical protein EPO06_07065 [Burkholderiaceae bacterium]|nr:MAG: hypothetical protein EPO06_07065 [Burkholderiaceae bacterium]